MSLEEPTNVDQVVVWIGLPERQEVRCKRALNSALAGNRFLQLSSCRATSFSPPTLHPTHPTEPRTPSRHRDFAFDRNSHISRPPSLSFCFTAKPLACNGGSTGHFADSGRVRCDQPPSPASFFQKADPQTSGHQSYWKHSISDAFATAPSAATAADHASSLPVSLRDAHPARWRPRRLRPAPTYKLWKCRPELHQACQHRLSQLFRRPRESAQHCNRERSAALQRRQVQHR